MGVTTDLLLLDRKLERAGLWAPREQHPEWTAAAHCIPWDIMPAPWERSSQKCLLILAERSSTRYGMGHLKPKY